MKLLCCFCPASSTRTRRLPPFLLLFLPPRGAGGRTGLPASGRGKDPACLSSSGARRALERVAGRLRPRGCHHGQQLCPQLVWMRRQCHLLGPQNGVPYTDVSFCHPRLGTPGPCSSLVPRQSASHQRVRGTTGSSARALRWDLPKAPSASQRSKCCCRCFFRPRGYPQLLGTVSPDPKGPMP